MKILILTSWYPSEKDEASGIFVREQAKALVQNGADIRVLYPFDKHKKGNTPKEILEDGIITYRCNTDYIKNSKLSRINSAIKTVVALNKIKKEFKFDIIHCHVCYFAGIIGYIYNKIYGTKYIITEHMSYISSYARKRYNYILLKNAYSSAKAVICVSGYLADNLIKLGFSFNKVIIGNVVDTSVFKIPQNVTFKDPNVNILFIGSMGDDEVKGVNYLLKAFSILAKTKENIKLHLVGDGTKRGEYEMLADSLDIGEYCIFHGKIDKSTVARVIQSCSFFVLPSKYETFGTVIIEALACGKPVVTTDKGAQKEIICNENLGLIVKSENAESLYYGLKNMVDNYCYYKPDYLREYAMNYNYECIASKICGLYKRLIRIDGEA